jgi:hypothetical protein
MRSNAASGTSNRRSMRIVGISEKLRFLIIRKSFAPGRIRCDKLGKCYFAQLISFVVGRFAIVVVGRFASRDDRYDDDIIDVPSHKRIEGGFAAARRRSLGSKFGAVTHDRTANPRAGVNFILSDIGSSFLWSSYSRPAFALSGAALSGPPPVECGEHRLKISDHSGQLVANLF